MPRGIKKGLNAKKFERCVMKVKRKSGTKVNPYAVCNASMSGKSKNKRKLQSLNHIQQVKIIVNVFLSLIKRGFNYSALKII